MKSGILEVQRRGNLADSDPRLHFQLLELKGLGGRVFYYPRGCVKPMNGQSFFMFC
jgi:hypothetical protein